MIIISKKISKKEQKIQVLLVKKINSLIIGKNLMVGSYEYNEITENFEMTVYNLDKNKKVCFGYHTNYDFVGVYEYLDDAEHQWIHNKQYKVNVNNILTSKRIENSINLIM